ncbi:MAG TPA: glycosyl hydrolase family 65 protein [Solirubrobacteraceae bacterium]|nr:glycosyl hydrolase family 65 protein [Solirubrobacteraceae bacterium]
MRVWKLACVTGAVMALAASSAAASGSFVLTATKPTAASGYAPTFTGNGLLGVRVPPTGQGYAGGTVPAQSELAGFYAKPTKPKTVSDAVQQRANIPTWSTLTFADGGQPFSLSAGTTTGWRQSLDLHTGVITTGATWRAPDGHTTKLSYQVFTDRGNAHLGLVQLTLTPQWSGTAAVTDEIDGAPATLTDEAGKGFDPTTHQTFVDVKSQALGIEAAIASQLQASANVTATPTEVDASKAQTIGQQISFPVTAGQTYTFTKFVGIDDSQDTATPVAAAQAEAAAAAMNGYDAASTANQVAWAALWNGRIDVEGNNTVASDVNASEFYLWSNTRDGVDWSISPAGLSSNGYDGHIFWDAETWMFPSLLAQHPDLAAGMNAYRFDRLSQAQQHATATGFAGARFPWESALDGTEQIPPPVSVNSEGLFEQHITADIALAQWQYYLVTGNKVWLATQGWPVISGAAAFWASHAKPGAGGSYHMDNVTDPDEENPDVNDAAFTNAGAKTTLQDAIAAAAAVGQTPPASWSKIAAGLTVPTAVTGGQRIHPEFAGYGSQLVKQADVTLLQYPWRYPMPTSVAQNDINYYVPRTDPGGPSMSDAVNEIDSLTLGTPGCSAFVYTERSYQPFIRDVFHQFSETRTGGAFTFMTGIGGFLQEFLYGYSGLRWDTNDVRLAPALNQQISGVRLHNLTWRGRTFQVFVGTHSTTVTLQSGSPLPLSTPQGARTVSVGHPITIPTARPDLTSSGDAVRCQSPKSSSTQPGAPALAAVDGSPATDWQPVRVPASLTTMTRAGHRTVGRVVVQWGRLWPAAPKPNVHPPAHPVKTLRPGAYTLQVSANGKRWVTVASVRGHMNRLTDTLTFPKVQARFVRVKITKGTGISVKQTINDKVTTVVQMPMLEELTATR